MTRIMVTMVCAPCARGLWFEWRSDRDDPVRICSGCGARMVERTEARARMARVGRVTGYRFGRRPDSQHDIHPPP